MSRQSPDADSQPASTHPVSPPTSSQWAALALSWSAVSGLLAWWLTTTPVPLLRVQLTRWQFWSLEIAVFVGAGLAVIEGRRLWREALVGHRRALCSVCLLACVTVVALPPSTHRLFFDEHIYQGIGQNLADLRLAQMCQDGVLEYGRLECRVGEYNKQPYAYPHLLSVVYRIVGVTDQVAPTVNRVAHVVTAATVYVIVLLQFGNAWAALLAGVIFTLTPEQLMWSATAAVEPTTAMAASLAVLATMQFVRTRRTSALAAVVVATAWAVQFRPEAVLLLLVVGTLLWQHARSEWRQPRMWWAVLAGLVLLAIHIGHLVAVRDDSWGASGARLSLSYVRSNLSVNGGFFLGDARFPIVYTALALAGAARHLGAALPLIVAFATCFGVPLAFYAGSYDYGADVRYSLTTYPWVAALAGVGAASFVTTFSRTSRLLLLGGLAGQFLWYTPLVRATSDEAWGARADVTFAKGAAAVLRGNKYVLTHNPAMFHVWGVNAGQMSMVSENASYANYLATRFAGGVYLHWNFWCNASDDRQRAVCTQAAAAHPLEEIARWDERDQRFRIYRYQVAAAAPLQLPPASLRP